MKKQAIEVRFLSDRFLKWVKINFNLLSMSRAILPSGNVGLPKSGNPTYAADERDGWNAKGAIILSLLLIFSAPITSFAKAPPILILSSGGRNSEGPNPKYEFKIYEDGLVLYHGDIKVKAKGDRQAKITKEQVQELTVTFRKIYNIFDRYEMFSKNKNYLWRDDPYFIQLTYQGETLKLSPGGFISYMFVHLNKMTPIENWICFDLNDPLKPEYDNCPFRFFPATPLN